MTQKKNRQQLQYLRDEALQAYLNREDFQYDLNGDALYRQYKDRYTQLGKAAMQDTMGQAAALTGGYGSSYAQSVGQQAYNSYMQQLGDVVPELYQLAYDRYRDKGDRLYKTYQSWALLEQQAAEEEQWAQEYALEERKRQDAVARSSQEEKKEQQKPTEGREGYRGKGTYSPYGDPTVKYEFDNGDVTTGNIMIIQRVIGMPETGYWTIENRKRAGSLTADEAWAAYQNGQLQNRYSHGLGDQGLPNADVRSMERVLGLLEDGYWSEEDKKAAGGMSEAIAWQAYQRGLLQLRKKT